MKASRNLPEASPWPHRVAVLLACATFPLIWVGGLVTTYDAGMAVPDWPTTYGHNLFLYPWQTWIFGPWDLFIEHGHRLLGALVGVLTIALVVVVWRGDDRRWLRAASLGALGLVILQGVLGGMRVLMDDRQLAKLHGCVGPAFFALAIALAVFTSRLWRDPLRVQRVPRAGPLQRTALLAVLFSYGQLVLGAHLRHVPVQTAPSSFRVLMIFHLILAAVVTVYVLLLALQMFAARVGPSLLRPALALSILVVVQLGLGAATWVVSYSWPSGLPEWVYAGGFTIQSQGWLESNIVTGHVATGSLLVGIGVQLALRSLRLLRPVETPADAEVALEEAIA